MRRIAAAIAIVLVMTTLATLDVTAQDPQPLVVVLSDPIGDVVYVTPTGEEIPGSPRDAQADIESATMRTENATHIALDLLLAEEPDLKGGADAFAFHFMFGDQAYRVASGGCRGGPWALKSGASIDAPAEEWTMITCLKGYFLDRPDAHMTAYVPHALVLDGHGGPLRSGSQITHFYATTSMSQLLSIDGYDRAPDEGYIDGIRIPDTDGAAATGFQLSSPFPVQFSNGGAGTILYTVFIDNLQDEPVSLLLGAESTPPDWEILHPSRLDIDAGKTSTITVLASVPFTHRHGVTDHFRLIAADESEPERRQVIQLGVHYPAVAQPAGHHPVLYLHSDTGAGGRVHAWMNANPESADPDDTNAPVKPHRVGVNPSTGVSTATWTLPLQPGLRIGLSFDQEGQGLLSTAIQPAVPVADGTIRSQVLLCDPGPTPDGVVDQFCQVGSLRVVAESQEEAFSAPTGQAVPVEQLLTLVDAPHRYDYEPRANLLLRVTLNRSADVAAFAADQESTLVVQDSRLELPLLEYGRDLRDQYAEGRALMLSLDKPSVRSVNPGKTLSFNATIANLDDAKHHVRLAAAGHNAHWIAWLDPVEMDVAAGGTARIAFTVTAPAAASANEYVEVTLVAQSEADPSAAALHGLRVVVTTSESVADESPAGGAGQEELGAESPGFAMGFLIVALAVAVAANRRRP